MSRFGVAERRWRGLTDKPTILATSANSGWRGFDFQVIEVPFEGQFNGQKAAIHLSQIFGPMRLRENGQKYFRDLFPVPRLLVPSRTSSGAWEGVQRGRHLFIEIDSFERMTHIHFSASTLEPFERPDPVCEHLLRALDFDIRSRSPSGPLLGETIVTAILEHLLRSAMLSSAPLPSDRLSGKEFERVRQFIEERLARNISLEQLSNVIGISPRHLSRRFKNTLGVSPYRYVMERRAARAKELILAGQLNFSEIAEVAGFSHQAHMTAVLRKLLGLTALQIRNSRR